MLISLSSHNLCIPASFRSPPSPPDLILVVMTRFISCLRFLICLTNPRKLLWLQHALTMGWFLGLDSHLALCGTTWDRCLPDKILERTRDLDEILETPKRLSAMFSHSRAAAGVEGEEDFLGEYPRCSQLKSEDARPTHKPTPWGQLWRLRGWMQLGVGGGQLLALFAAALFSSH